ncbi:MAG: hypothetical protein ACJAZX_000845 [Rickettsiales bacterium]|jgi:hypothetical protein
MIIKNICKTPKNQKLFDYCLDFELVKNPFSWEIGLYLEVKFI